MKTCACIVFVLCSVALLSQQNQTRTQYPSEIYLGPAPQGAPQSAATPPPPPQTTDSDQVSIRITVVIVDKDLNAKPVPKAKLIIKQVESINPSRCEASTGFDGVALVSVPPGRYRLISAHPTDFQGKSYNWDVEVTVSESQNKFELSNDNAAIAELAPAANVDNLSAVYKKYRDSIVTVLAEYGPAKGTGFVIDSSGLILTNQHVVRTSQWIAVQVDDSHRLPATLLAADSEKDVAVLRVNPAKLPVQLPAVSLLPLGGEPAIEGERVFTIGSPLHQSKVMTTGIVSKVEKRAIISDVNINHGNSGGPLFNSQGLVIGITTFGDSPRGQGGGPGISGILRIEQAREVIADAKSKLKSTPVPSADLLPNDPQDTYPLDSIKRTAQLEKFDIRPYTFGVGDYDVAIITPVVRYRHYSSDVRAARQKEKRNRKRQAAAETFQPLDELKGWEEYVGEYTPVIFIQASPKLKETFWSAFSRGMAASRGYVTGPASMHFKTDFYQMKLFCGTTEIQPLWPGKAERVLDVNNAAIRITDATFDGLYEYPANAIRPDCGKIRLDLFSEKEPDKPKVKELDGKTVSAVYRDFEPYREQTSNPK